MLQFCPTREHFYCDCSYLAIEHINNQELSVESNLFYGRRCNDTLLLFKLRCEVSQQYLS